jgi:hypothetical protein
VVGWQVIALKSGDMGYLTVNPNTVAGATRFLDFVQADGGGRYGYNIPGNGAATSAIGLLCRMYLGWPREHAGIVRGAVDLNTLGPSRDNMYFNYYATQVLHHYGGEDWEQWNAVMREQLVQTQETQGHAAGSWAPRDPHGRSGGRLYMTCLAILTLEVYYRHLPLYQKRATETAE